MHSAHRRWMVAQPVRSERSNLSHGLEWREVSHSVIGDVYMALRVLQPLLFSSASSTRASGNWDPKDLCTVLCSRGIDTGAMHKALQHGRGVVIVVVLPAVSRPNYNVIGILPRGTNNTTSR